MHLFLFLRNLHYNLPLETEKLSYSLLSQKLASSSGSSLLYQKDMKNTLLYSDMTAEIPIPQCSGCSESKSIHFLANKRQRQVG